MAYEFMKHKIYRLTKRFFQLSILIFINLSIGYSIGLRNRHDCVHPAALEGCEYAASTFYESLDKCEYFLARCKEVLESYFVIIKTKENCNLK